MFLVNSRFPLDSATTTQLVHRVGSPFSRSYGGILPSSLTTVHPLALVFSTRSPVSVWGTGRPYTSLEAFLDSTGSPPSPLSGYASRLTLQCVPDLPRTRTTRLHQHNQRLAWLPLCVTPSLDYDRSGPTHPHTPHTPKGVLEVILGG